MKNRKFDIILIVLLIVGICTSISIYVLNNNEQSIISIILQITIMIAVTYLGQKSYRLSRNEPINVKAKTLTFLFRFSIFAIISINLVNMANINYKNINSEMLGSLIMVVIMIVFGNLSPKISEPGNIGLRVPWTRNDKEVWRKTHVFIGYISFPFALIQLGLTLFIKPFYGFLFGTFLWFVLGVVYSMVLYYKKHGSIFM